MRKNKIKKLDVICIGGATRDIMFYSGEGELVTTSNLTKQKLLAFEYGAKITADDLYFNFGGGAANTAVSFTMVGLKVGIVCRLGNDENGRAVLKNLKDKSIETALIKIDQTKKTGFSMILTINNPAKEHILFTYRGSNDDLSFRDIKLANYSTDWFYVSSLPALGWEKIIKNLTAYKKKIAWNPGSQQLASIDRVKKFLPKIEVLFLNRDEALEFKKLKNIKSLLKYLHGLGPRVVVITDGAAGAYTYDGQKYYFLKARSSKNVDTVGVGDAFNSAFTSALIYGKSIKDALRWGINNSASVVAQIGAQNGLLSKRQITR
ncbi:MAG TPA: PfkB family carbohydrate kinase [bacterium]|mgnify:CR=1 FL=1|nr:PfkB family carbohydrate kinase [bacterium]HNS33720.1 PfkB family carbohydrate kinase [bacterium]HNW09199.1 PfkB family carbohydrate kinase [bacterium]HNZ73379.1 PfkB family carbohydrate kinase [bacterium]HPN81214.1 PfkB family carbohydrate kinase [bacterium]